MKNTTRAGNKSYRTLQIVEFGWIVVDACQQLTLGFMSTSSRLGQRGRRCRLGAGGAAEWMGQQGRRRHRGFGTARVAA